MEVWQPEIVSFLKIPSIYNQRKQVCPLRVERHQLCLQVIKRDDLTENEIKYAKVCSKHCLSGKLLHINVKI